MFVQLEKARHDRAAFDCGEKELNDYFKTKAAKHMQSGISRTMVLPDNTAGQGKHPVQAFYTITPGSICTSQLPQSLAKKLPQYPVPVFLIAQLAVNRPYQGKGLGERTLVSALQHLLRVSQELKAYAVIVDCLNDDIVSFYRRYGFSPLEEPEQAKVRMFLPMNQVYKAFYEGD